MHINTLKHMKKTIYTAALLTASLAAQAQIADNLKELGMENIRVAQADNETVVAFEDNVYRGTYRGIGKAIHTILDTPETSGRDLQLVVLENSVPKLCIAMPSTLTGQYKAGTIGISDVYRQMEMSCETDEAMDKLKQSGKAVNSSAGKVDIVIYPEAKLRNSGFDELYTYYVNLAPAVEMDLWKGAQFTAQVVFPIVTNLHGQYEKIRPGVMTLSQEFAFGKSFLGRVVAGNFTNNRMGLQAEAEWRSKDGRYKLGAVAGTTMQSIVTDKDGWFISQRQRVNAFAKASYYEPHYNLQFDLQAGRYVYGDVGVRGDCTHYFGDYSIGVYALYTEGEVNGGFHFALPMPGKKWSRNRGVRVRQAEYFAMEYSMRSWGKYEDQNLAETYRTRPNENRSSGFFQPDFIRYYLIKEEARNANKKADK